MTAAAVVTAADLAALLTGQLRLVHALSPARPGGWQELTCAADVAGTLAAIIGASADEVPGPGFLPPACPLVSIPVIISPDSAPGTWRLITHDHCEVRGEHPDAWVSHEACTITGEGCLT